MIVNHLKIIVAIANVGSYSIASKNLYVSQPYLTKIVKKVEKIYDLKIFKRNKTGVELTNDGKEFIDKAKILLKQVDSLNIKSDNKNIVDLKISSFPSSYAMEAYIDFYKKIDASKNLVRCNYYEKNTIEVIEDVAMHACDIGIISIKNLFFEQNSLYFSNKEIIYEKLFDLVPTIICKTNHPLLKKKNIKLSDLYNYNLVTFENIYDPQFMIFDEGYYNDKNLSHIFEFNKFKNITYVNTRSGMHSILHNSNKMAIGNCMKTKRHKLFDLTFIPLENIIKDINFNEISNSMYYVHLKSHPLSKYSELYLKTLKNIYLKHL